MKKRDHVAEFNLKNLYEYGFKSMIHYRRARRIYWSHFSQLNVSPTSNVQPIFHSREERDLWVLFRGFLLAKI